MRIVIALLFVLVPAVVTAQPAPSSAPAAGSGSAAPAAGSAAPAAGSAGSAAPIGSDPSTAPQAVMPKVPDAPPAPAAADLRKTCADAMNADPTFADAIVKSINEDTYLQHARAADAIKKNEKHVVLAYAAFWALTALFVVFLWRRQQGLKGEIAQLKRDLDAASK